jgi:23S rRNA (cytosine1962-C5)-methyltransferase
MALPPLRLRKNEERRLKAGHLWVFSNEVDVAATPLTGFEPGAAVDVFDSRGALLGSAYVNPRSLICARLISRGGGRSLDERLLTDRIGRALALRERLFPDEPFYRLVFGEGDFLPGLVVDRYGDVLVVQITTAGMDRVADSVISTLRDATGATGIVLRNDTPARSLEGLPLKLETIGEVPDRITLRENGTRFAVSLTHGQKTGWFFDHRRNRQAMRRYVPGRRVLDVFSYAGGWAVQAAVAGASEVVCVDSSAAALDDLRSSAELNGVADRVRPMQADAFEALRDLRAAGERFDVVILDPPAFIKRRKDQKQGEKAYARINQAAMEVLSPDGILMSASCSYHLSRDALLLAMLRASREAGRELQVLEEGHQAADHPIHPAIPETAYLKSFIARLE